MTIGERIKNRRESLGISQVSLADTIGEKKQTLYKYENNIVTNIPIDKISLIAEALKTTPSFIMGWDEPGDWVEKFRTALEEILIDADWVSALDSGIDIERLRDVASGDIPLTFELACDVAIETGISLDELLYKEIHKKPAPESEDRLDAEIYELLMALSPEKLEAAKSYLRYLKSQEENP